MLIAFEGVDGAGKTTTAPLVARKLAEFGFDVVATSKRETAVQHEFAREQLEVLIERLWGVPHDERLNSLGTLHWIYLNAAFFAGTHYALHAELGHGRVAVFDNWINKFLARVTTSGEFKIDDVLGMLSLLPQPDLVFFLDVSPATAVARKEAASALERGALHEGEVSFEAYQTMVYEILEHMAERLGWITIEPGGRPPEEIADGVAEMVRVRLTNTPATA